MSSEEVVVIDPVTQETQEDSFNAIFNEEGEVNYWIAFSSVFAANALLYIVCQIVKDNSWIDVMWGLTFIFPNAVILAGFAAAGLPIDTRTIVVNSLVALWGVRLALHIGIRHNGEDYRYVQMRGRWEPKGRACYYIASFLYIFMMQAVFSLVANGAVIYLTGHSSVHTLAILEGPKLLWTDYVGWAVFAIGFLFEVVGDWQLTKHIANTDPQKGKFIDTGLWKYTRHPNYFGECMLWWGLYISTCSLPGGYWYFFAPLFITLLIRFVSGVTMLERKQSKHPEWKQYADRTAIFFPWFPKAKESDSDFTKPAEE